MIVFLNSRIATPWLVAALLALLLVYPSCADEAPPLSNVIVGREFAYVVRRADSLTSVGARFGVEVNTIAVANGLAPLALLREGQTLRIDNRHIVPAFLDKGILINVPQRMLFHFNPRDGIRAFPVGLGRPDWPTPSGRFRIVSKRENPAWNVPQSIQEEMRREGKTVTSCVPPGPDNPLGTHWLGLSIPGYGIHSTIAPTSIYFFRTHGCIRLHPDDIAEIFPEVTLGTPGQIVYQRFMVAKVGSQVFLEVHRDIYRKEPHPRQKLLEMIRTHDLASPGLGEGKKDNWETGRSRSRGHEKNHQGSIAMIEKHSNPHPTKPLTHLEAIMSRRTFLAFGAVTAVAGVLPRPLYGYLRDTPTAERSLAFYNTHTGEQLSTVYWLQGEYVPESLTDIDHILRGHRTNEVKKFDKRLLDLLFSIRTKLETNQPFYVISGYRSAETNNLLRSQSSGIAKTSLHMIGEAIDFRVPGRALSLLREVAIDLRGGGVGYYPQSDFVHVDVGRVRYW